MKVSYRVEGGKELARALDQLSTRVSAKVAREALTEAAEPFQKTATQLAPVEPGAPDLKANIVISPVRGQDAMATVAIGPAKGFFYGFFQEYGTVRHGAQPFMRPAFDSQVQAVLTRMSAAAWRILAGRRISRTVDAPTVVQAPGGGGLL